MSGNTTARPRNADRRIVGGLFADLASAKNAVQDLKSAGFTEGEIGLAMRDRTDRGELIGETGTKAGAEAVKGAVGGGILGGLAGFLVAAGVLTIPGLGPVIAGGALASTFGLTGGAVVTGAGLGAATGGVMGGLVGLEIPEPEARQFDAGVRSGRVLVIVRTESRVKQALEILERHGGETGVGGGSREPTGQTLL